MITLTKWSRPSNYCGVQWDGYYVGLSRSRDSDLLAQSNFDALLERLGGESIDDESETPAVVVARASHWACGWVETILIHETAADAVEVLRTAMQDLEDYPVLDEGDFSEREFEEQNSTFDNNEGEFCRAVAEYLGMDDDRTEAASEMLSAVAREIYVEDCSYCGVDQAWVTERSIERAARSEYTLKELAKNGNIVAQILIEGKAA